MTDDADTTIDDERIEELSSIASIFPELTLDPNDPYSATLELPVTPLEPLRIFFKPTSDGALLTPPTSTEPDQDDSGVKPQVQQPVPLDSQELSHLPPLSLRIHLPSGYPTAEPPVVELSVSPLWLPQSVLNRLQDDSVRLWEEVGKDMVLYTYIIEVQEEAESAFGLAASNIHLSSDLRLALLDFDLKAKREQFDKETFDCGICLEPKKGTHCHRLLQCGHVFCVSCLQDFYKSCITEGDVDNVKCLSPSCGKEKWAGNTASQRPSRRRDQDQTLNPSELLQIPLDHELVQRYVRLKRKKRLESDKNTIYCPRQWCQGAARTKKHPKPIDPLSDTVDDKSESEEEQPRPDDLESLPMADRLCICEDCELAFCCVCRKGWHGEIANCSPRRQKELNEEEAASAAYIQSHSTPCPTCNVRAQKTMGCNHMICTHCKTHFCYLCASYLPEDNPYSHYNDIDNPCYHRLWVLEAGDGEGVDINAHFNPDAIADWAEEADEEDELLLENFQAFNGGRRFEDEEDEEDEDTSDDEPAPDVRRNREMHIEIVNFGGPGGQNAQRFALPARPRAPIIVPPGPPPPPVPNPPRRPRQRRGGGQPANRLRAMRNEPARVERNLPAQNLDRNLPQPAQPAGNAGHEGLAGRGILPAAPVVVAAPGQGNNQGFAQGLERFLRLAQEDQEDEWDSDELDEDDDVGGFAGHEVLEPPLRRRGRAWV